jgi:predicted metal-dependent hydrolase
MNYEIKRSKRKTLSIQVYRDQRVQVRAPLRCKDSEIERFVAKHEDWVRNKLDESLEYPGLPESKFVADGYLWLLGEKHFIEVNLGKPNSVVIEEGKIIVTQLNLLDVDKTYRLINNWKADYAATLFNERLNIWAAQFPIRLPSFQFKLRKMKRQWGNCNHKGIITINSQLIRYPLHCIDYVLVHELTHLKHLNHGKNFYRLMEEVCPDWNQQRLLLAQFSGVD